MSDGQVINFYHIVALSRILILHKKSSTLPSRAQSLCQKNSIKMPEKEHKRVRKKRQKQDLLNKVLYLIDLVVHVSFTSKY